MMKCYAIILNDTIYLHNNLWWFVTISPFLNFHNFGSFVALLIVVITVCPNSTVLNVNGTAKSPLDLWSKRLQLTQSLSVAFSFSVSQNSMYQLVAQRYRSWLVTTHVLSICYNSKIQHRSHFDPKRAHIVEKKVIMVQDSDMNSTCSFKVFDKAKHWSLPLTFHNRLEAV